MATLLFRSTVAGLAAKAISSIGVLFIIPVMLGQLGNTTYGIWMTITSAVGLMAFLDLGFGNHLMSQIAKNKDNKPLVIEFISTAYSLQVVIIFPIILFFIAGFRYINWNAILNLENPSADILSGILITYCFFFGSIISNTIYAIQRGLQRSDLANTWQLISSIVSLSILYIVLKVHPSIVLIAIASFGIPTGVALANSIWFLRRNGLFRLKLSGITSKRSRNFFTNSSVLLYLQVAALIAFQSDVLILAHYTDFGEVSKFTIASKIFSIPIILAGIYFQVAWPAYTHAYAKNNWNWIKKNFYYSLYGSFAMVLLFIAGVYFLRPFIAVYWLHSHLTIPADLFFAFSIWIIINNWDNNIATILNGLQILKIQVLLSFLMVGTNVLLSIYLVKNYGTPGVIWGSAISTLLFSVLPLFIYVQKLLKGKCAQGGIPAI